MLEGMFSHVEAPQIKTPLAQGPDICYDCFNPNKPYGFSHPYTLGESICHLRGVRCILFICVVFVIENPVSKE